MGQARFSGRSQYILDVDCAVASQDYGANTSRIYWRVIVIKESGDGYWSGTSGANNGSAWSNVGGLWSNGAFSYDFRPGGRQDRLIADGYFTVGHDANGYANYQIGSTVNLNNGIGGATAYSDIKSAPRIPKPPQTPGTPSIGTVTPTSVALSWGAPDNMGSGISNYIVQYATNSAFTTGVGSQNFGSNSGTVTGLTPGLTYWFRVLAQNGMGNSPWSGSSSTLVGLPAPTLTGWAQNTSGGLVASWTAPSITTGLTGYRVQIARDAGFTTGVQNVDFGNVLTGTITGLAGGRQYFARVAARTAGGTNTYSNALSTVLVLSAGELDGWTRIGTKPSQISYYTSEGLRRGTVGTAQALYLESLSTGSVTLAADTFGIQKVITGLTVGKAFRFEASATLTGSPLADSYRLRVLSESSATPVTVTSSTTDLGYIEFVADSSTVTLQILLAESVTVTGAVDEVEKIALHGMRLLELDTDYPERLRSTVYESNLANHFDLACVSVGATWYVDKAGVTQFRLPGAALPVSAVFSDDTLLGALSYVDITAGYDTRSTVNRIEAKNFGIGADGNEENDELVVEDMASQLAYGIFSAYLDLNLYTLAPYDESFQDRLDELLDAYAEPSLLVSSIRWNAQEDLDVANALEVGQRILVRYREVEQDSQIVAIQHDITPTRWMVSLTLQRIG